MRPIDRTILDFANAHGGVVTRHFLEQVNLSRGQIEMRVRRHGWKSLGRGAYRVLEARDVKDRLAGAVAAIDASAVSHESAAELHVSGCSRPVLRSSRRTAVRRTGSMASWCIAPTTSTRRI